MLRCYGMLRYVMLRYVPCGQLGWCTFHIHNNKYVFHHLYFCFVFEFISDVSNMDIFNFILYICNVSRSTTFCKPECSDFHKGYRAEAVI